MGEFKLRCELIGHQEDVRGLCVSESGLITSSRDKTIKIWTEDGLTSFQLLHTLVGHTNYVAPLACISPGQLPSFTHGAIVSGSFDTTVRVWDAATTECVQKLTGHTYQVTSVVVLPNGDIVSASVDSTVRTWRNAKCIRTLDAHDGRPVLSLAVTPQGELLTGSGDSTIRRWAGGTCVHTYKGHTDTVRCLAILPGIGFVSASHDTTLRVWALSGETLAELVGHSAIVYACGAAASGTLVASGSEDNTMRLWRPTGECLQVIQHPGNLWAVAFLESGDVISACSDSVARVFSADPDRQATEEAAAAFTSAVNAAQASRAAAAQQAGGDGGAGGGGGDGLPPGVTVVNPSALINPGSKDGETKLVREANGGVWAYGWSATRFEWEQIGEVVAAPEAGSVSGPRKWHEGQEWDFVWDVELDAQHGRPPLKLACNRGDNPYIVADGFLAANDLPAEFREQIVQFVIQNSGGSAGPSLSSAPITGGFCDPFTGGGGGSAAAAPPPPRPQFQPQPLSSFTITGGGVDPFTGTSTRTPAGGAGSSAGGQVPASTYLLFDNVPPGEALAKKLREFSAELALGSFGTKELALAEEQLRPGGELEALVLRLPAAVSGRGGALPANEAALLERLLAWPAGKLFPGLDIARCLALDAAAAQQLAAGAAGVTAALTAAAAGGVAAAMQTALRLVANCFKHTQLREWVVGSCQQLLDGFSSAEGYTKAARLSLATVLLNFAVAARQLPGRFDAEVKAQLLSALEALLGALPGDEADGLHRSVVALGTLVAGDADMTGLAKDLGLGERLGGLAAGGGKVGEAALEVQRLLA